MAKPTVVIATERFADLARLAAEQSGLPDARIVSVAHPVGGVSKDELLKRADASIEALMSRLLGR